MEASKLQKKNKTISKGKLKKAVKNILCRPDPSIWPVISEEDEKYVVEVLTGHKVVIPEFKKPHWSEIKHLPKDQRPKPQKIPKVDGLMFGINTCYRYLQEGKCSCVLIETQITPRLLVEHIVERCKADSVHILAIKDLKQITTKLFGFPTSCLSFKENNNNVASTTNIIKSIAQKYNYTNEDSSIKEELIDSAVSEESENKFKCEDKNFSFSYVYRTSRNTRGFIPKSEPDTIPTNVQGFKGQDFIEFAKLSSKSSGKKSFKNMIVKRITSNPNRKNKK